MSRISVQMDDFLQLHIAGVAMKNIPGTEFNVMFDFGREPEDTDGTLLQAYLLGDYELFDYENPDTVLETLNALKSAAQFCQCIKYLEISVLKTEEGMKTLNKFRNDLSRNRDCYLNEDGKNLKRWLENNDFNSVNFWIQKHLIITA